MNTIPYPQVWAKCTNDATEGSYYPLVCHLLDTAAAALALWDHWLRPGLKELLTDNIPGATRELVAYACAMHDIGKANPVFAGQLASPAKQRFASQVSILEAAGLPVELPPFASVEPGRIRQSAPFLARHEQASSKILAPGFNFKSSTLIAEAWLATVAGCHHGTLIIPNSRDKFPAFAEIANTNWREVWSEIDKTVRQALGIENIPESVAPHAVLLLCGLVVPADRIASTSASVKPGLGLLKNYESNFSGAKWVDSRYSTMLEIIKNELGIYQPFSDAQNCILGQYSPNLLQQEAISQKDSGLWLVMAPTGIGKTEAAMLRHSTKDERVAFFLPTQATTTAMMHRLQKMYQGTPNVATLAHGQAFLDDFYNQNPSSYLDAADDASANTPSGLFPSSFMKYAGARLLAPVTVGTIDQALVAALPGKWAAVRLLALANAHIIIDEAHILDAYMRTLLEPLLFWLGLTKTRITVLSATLPQAIRDSFINSYQAGLHMALKESPTQAYPPAIFPSTVAVGRNIDTTDLAQCANPHTLQLTYYEIPQAIKDPNQVGNAHIEWHQSMRKQFPKARLGIICNKIDTAQKVAQAIRSDDEKIIVLHSRMTFGHRVENTALLEQLLGKNGDETDSITVIGTQTLEASLDIDLDALSTVFAPAPALIQRAGRVWRRPSPNRHNRISGFTGKPINLVRWHNSCGSLPYQHAEINRAWEWLDHRDIIELPQMMQSWIETNTPQADTEEQTQDMLAEEIEIINQATHAENARINLEYALYSYAEVSEIAKITSRDDVDEEATTRLIERESSNFIITGNCKYAFSKDFDAIATLNQVEIRNLLRHAIRISSKPLLAKIKGKTSPLPVDSPYLQDFELLQLDDEVTYDPNIGLVLK